MGTESPATPSWTRSIESFVDALLLERGLSERTARAYGVLKAFGLYAARHTIYIGKDGKVLLVDTEVNPRTAGGDLVARLEELGVRRSHPTAQ